MPHGLKRFQQSAQSHFVTFTCYHRRQGYDTPAVYDLFVQVLEQMRGRFALCVYGYVVMPEHVHLLLSEPQRGLLADALHYLKLSFAKRLVAQVRAPILGANLGSGMSSPGCLSLASPDPVPSTLTRFPRLLFLAAHSDESCSTAKLPEACIIPPSRLPPQQAKSGLAGDPGLQ